MANNGKPRRTSEATDIPGRHGNNGRRTSETNQPYTSSWPGTTDSQQKLVSGFLQWRRKRLGRISWEMCYVIISDDALRIFRNWNARAPEKMYELRHFQGLELVDEPNDVIKWQFKLIRSMTSAAVDSVQSEPPEDASREKRTGSTDVSHFNLSASVSSILRSLSMKDGRQKADVYFAAISETERQNWKGDIDIKMQVNPSGQRKPLPHPSECDRNSFDTMNEPNKKVITRYTAGPHGEILHGMTALYLSMTRPQDDAAADDDSLSDDYVDPSPPDPARCHICNTEEKVDLIVQASLWHGDAALAERWMHDCPQEGTFILRPARDKNGYTLMIRGKWKTYKFKIKHDCSERVWIFPNVFETFKSLGALVDYYFNNLLPEINIRLQQPYRGGMGIYSN